MNPHLTFTDPPEAVQQARIALAAVECRLALTTDALELCCDLTTIGLAFLTLEAVHPCYPPLFDVAPSADPHADLIEAIRLLGEAAAEAETAADVVRYGATIVDLYHLDLLAEAPDPGTGGCSAQWS